MSTRAVLLLLVSLASAAVAAPPLTCTRDLDPSPQTLETSVPTDVAVDGSGSLYVLFGREGRLRVLSPDGTALRTAGRVGLQQAPAQMTPVHLWTGAGGRPGLLACQVGQSQPGWRLEVHRGRLQAHKLTGASLSLPVAAADGPDGRFYVVSGQTLHAFGASGALQYRVILGGLTAPRALAVDSRRQVYLLHAPGLQVLDAKGQTRYRIGGARAFDLAEGDRLLVVGENWIRKYATDGRLLTEVSGLEETSAHQVVACALSRSGEIFVYLRDPATGQGLIVRRDAQGRFLQEFAQPARLPSGKDPGIRLDERGRVLLWDAASATLQRVHPAGRTELRAGYAPEGQEPGVLSRPADLAVDGDLVWVADTGNCRLQRLSTQGRWLEPISVGIRGGANRAEPRQVAVDGRGTVLCVVHPPSGQGQVVLQRRDRRGRLLSQGDLGEAAGNPIIKMAVGPDGSLFLYRSDPSLPVPVLTRLDSKGHVLARVGGQDRNFHLPGQVSTRISLKPEEDMVAWERGVILPVADRLAFVNPRLEVYAVQEVRHPRRDSLRTTPDYGGGALSQGHVLYLTDLANGLVHRIPLEAR